MYSKLYKYALGPGKKKKIMLPPKCMVNESAHFDLTSKGLSILSTVQMNIVSQHVKFKIMPKPQ